MSDFKKQPFPLRKKNGIYLDLGKGVQEIKPISPKGNQPWVLIGRTDTEAEAPILWPLDAKSQLIGKDPDAGKDWMKGE